MNSVVLSNLKQFRLDNGWTQDVVSKLSGVSSRTLQRIESGGSTSIETAKSLASVFELDSYKKLLASSAPTETGANQTVSSEKDDMPHSSEYEDTKEAGAVNQESLSWWERNIEHNLFGILVIVALALLLMSVRYLLPTSFTQEETALSMQFSVLFSLAIIFGVAQKIMRGVGIWGDVCNIFRRYPEPVNVSETTNGLSIGVMLLLFILHAYTLYFNAMHYFQFT